MLKMNRAKIELVILNASHRPPSSLTSISVCDELISKTSTARNIGVLYDTVMSVKHHLTAVCKAIEGHNGGVRVSCFLLGLVCTTGSLDETKRR